MIVLRALFYFAVFGAVTSGIYCGLVLAAARRFRKIRLAEEKQPADFLPPISVLKPLHGREDGLEENIEGFFHQTYPTYEVIFCARQDDDEGLQLARKVAARHPSVPARFIACGEPVFPNPKMYSLSVMAEAAKYEHLVTSDADARISPDYLSRCIQALENPGMSLASCVYVGLPLDNRIATRLDAIGKSVEMTSGVLVADMLSGADFALGVTMILKREAFHKAGGYEDLGNYWAEDFVLGNRLAAQKAGVMLSTHVIGLTVEGVPFAKSFRNQLRWMQSTRRSRPWGHLGTGLTFAMPFGLLALIAGPLAGHPIAGLALFALSLVNRWMQSFAVLRALGVSTWFADSLIYPLRDLTGFMIWCASYLPIKPYYHGGRFELTPDGRLERAIQHD